MSNIYKCSHCEKRYSDHSPDFIFCDRCGRNWCSLECGEADGFKTYSCKREIDLYCGRPEDECLLVNERGNCYGCESLIEESCNYCRKQR